MLKNLIVILLTLFLIACFSTPPRKSNSDITPSASNSDIEPSKSNASNSDSAPDASNSDYISTINGGFLIQDGKIKYGITYLLNQRPSKNLTYIAIFENPKPNSTPLTVSNPIPKGKSKFYVESTALPGITNNKNYLVTLKLFSNGNLISKHEQELQFKVPNSVLKKLKIKEY